MMPSSITRQLLQTYVVMEVNYFGAVGITQKFLPLIRAHKGRIVNMSSLAGLLSAARQGAYAASKFALEALTDSLRRELAPLGVAVVSVNPAFIKAKIGYKYVDDQKNLDQTHSSVYQHVIGAHVEKFIQRCLEKADEPTLTSAAITHAVFDAKPNDRYFVGNTDGTPAILLALFARVLPSYLLDAILASMA